MLALRHAGLDHIQSAFSGAEAGDDAFVLPRAGVGPHIPFDHSFARPGQPEALARCCSDPCRARALVSSLELGTWLHRRSAHLECGQMRETQISCSAACSRLVATCRSSWHSLCCALFPTRGALPAALPASVPKRPQARQIYRFPRLEGSG